MGAREGRWFFLLCAVALGYVMARAVCVPVVHDEAATYGKYVPFGEFLPWKSHPDAGNHFLNTALGIVGDRLFGMKGWALRWGSVLAFVLYAWCAWRTRRYLQQNLVRWCVWCALLLCPFVLEFFSLFRGYGLAMAFLLWGLVGLLGFVRARSAWALAQALIGLLLANTSVLALLPPWLIVLGMTAVVVALERKRKRPVALLLAVWFAFGVLPFAWAVRLAAEMRSDGLLYYGSLEGFIPVTLASLSDAVLGTQQSISLMVLIGTGVVLAWAALRRAWSVRSFAAPLVVIVALLWIDVAARVVMAGLLRINFPEDRAAMHMIPIFILGVALAIDGAALERPAWRWAALVLLILPLRTVFTANLDHTTLWPDQSVPRRFLAKLALWQAEQERPLAIGCYHQTGQSLPFEARSRGLSLASPLTDGFPRGPHDVRIARADQLAMAHIGFEEEDFDAGTGLHLLRRSRPLVLEGTPPRSFGSAQPMPEFMEVFSTDALSGEELLVHVHAEVLAVEQPALHLVVEVRDSTDHAIHYDAAEVTAFTPRRAVLDEIRHVPDVPGGKRALVYFWNARSRAVVVRNGVAVAYRVHQ